MIGLKIYEIRRKRGLTLSELAERADISKSYLSNIERNLNQNPSIQVVTKIAGVLDVDLKTLINKEKEDEMNKDINQELLEFANELQESGIGKEKIEEFRPLIEFIKWRNSKKDV